MIHARRYVDFWAVLPEHEPIHARLENWARWCCGRGGATSSPMFRLYRAGAGWDEGQAFKGAVDTLDAQKIQRGVTKLPHRPRIAVGWCYVRRSNPRSMASALGTDVEGLHWLVHSAREMLAGAT